MTGFTGTIITLGGGGFSFLGHITPLDDAILRLTGTARPRVCFVPTASGDDRGYIQRFERAFGERAETSVLSLFTKTDNSPGEPESATVWTHDPHHVLSQHVIYVGGGSTANLLAVWRLHGLPDLLREAAANGTVLAGISAGMNCWFEASSTDSFGPLAPLNDGLGFLPGSACPHLFGEEGRAEKFETWVADGSLPEGHAADDYVALVWRDGALVDAIAERPDHPALRMTKDGAASLPVRVLGDGMALAISALLYADDAMGLRESGAPLDEYDSEARMLADALRSADAAMTPPQIAERLHEIFVLTFDSGSTDHESTAPSSERFAVVAEAISATLAKAD